MAELNIGIIDDGYPTMESVLDVDKINKMTLEEQWGSEIDLRELNIRLIGEVLKWKRKIKLKSYTHPSFYFNEYDYNQDFLVYDWEYKPESNSDDYLFDILNLTKSHVFIYSAWDKIDNIPQILENDRFIPFLKEERYEIVNKSDDKSEDIILNKIIDAFTKGENINWKNVILKFYPSKYLIDFDDF